MLSFCNVERSVACVVNTTAFPIRQLADAGLSHLLRRCLKLHTAYWYCRLATSLSPRAMQPLRSECVPVLDIAEYQLPVYNPVVTGIHGKRLFLQI